MYKMLCQALLVAGLGFSHSCAAEEQAWEAEQQGMLAMFPEQTETQMADVWAAIEALKNAGDLSDYDLQAVEMSKGTLEAMNGLLTLEWQEDKETFEEFAKAHPGFFSEGEDSLKLIDFKSLSTEDAHNIMKAERSAVLLSKRAIEHGISYIPQRIQENKEFMKMYGREAK